MKRVTYSSNNSGGYWWLSDDDWKALEDAGWVVCWANKDPNLRRYTNSNGRYLDALATSAYYDCWSEDEAKAVFEAVTGQDADDEGCHCCGGPHSFYEEPLVIDAEFTEGSNQLERPTRELPA